MAKRRLKIRSYVRGRPSVMVKDAGSSDDTDRSVDTLGDINNPWEINPDLVKKRAKELYLLYGWSKAQLLELGMPETTLDVWLYQPTQGKLSWHQEKELFERSVLNKMKEQRSEELSETAARMLGVIKRSIAHMDMEQVLLKKPREVKEMIDSLSKLDTIINLEEGKPTQITESFSFTQKAVSELVAEMQELDPLIDYDARGKVN